MSTQSRFGIWQTSTLISTKGGLFSVPFPFQESFSMECHSRPLKISEEYRQRRSQLQNAKRSCLPLPQYFQNGLRVPYQRGCFFSRARGHGQSPSLSSFGFPVQNSISLCSNPVIFDHLMGIDANLFVSPFHRSFKLSRFFAN